jgi:hypothetical protein
MWKVVAVVVLGFACSAPSHDKPVTVRNTVKPLIPIAEGAEHPEAVGLWRVPFAERRRDAPGVASIPGIVRFLYDGKHVTLFLVAEKPWMWRSQDEHYRLASEWQGDKLAYRPPFGRMSPFVRFVNGRFESLDDKPPFRYESVASREAADKDDLVLLADRPVHDYNIKPMDPR